MDELTRKRLEHNEAVFKSVNEEIDERAEDSPRTPEYVCECADAGCSATIRLSHAQYEHVRREPNWYAVLPGHEVPEVERVVQTFDDYLIVQKH